MNMLKRRIFRLLFLGEIVLFGYYYLYGTQGLLATYALIQEMKQTQIMIDNTVDSMHDLEKLVYAWNHEPFLKEQWAREKLQLAHPHDIIYFTPMK